MEINQIVKLENRKSLLVTGVKNVKSFDSKEFILDTRLGILEIEGKDLILYFADSKGFYNSLFGK